MQNTGDPRVRGEIVAIIEHVLSDRAGEWRVSIVGSHANDMLNRDLELEDRPFQTKEVAERLGNTGDAVLTLYWSRTRPRR